jgi:hypothetical protein
MLFSNVEQGGHARAAVVPSPGLVRPNLTILPIFCRSYPHRAVPTRINPDDDRDSIPAEQGECGSGGSSRTHPDEYHPAENGKVGGSIPSLPTASAQLIELRAGLPHQDGLQDWGILGAAPS